MKYEPSPKHTNLCYTERRRPPWGRLEASAVTQTDAGIDAVFPGNTQPENPLALVTTQNGFQTRLWKVCVGATEPRLDSLLPSQVLAEIWLWQKHQGKLRVSIGFRELPLPDLASLHISSHLNQLCRNHCVPCMKGKPSPAQGSVLGTGHWLAEREHISLPTRRLV